MAALRMRCIPFHLAILLAVASLLAAPVSRADDREVPRERYREAMSLIEEREFSAAQVILYALRDYPLAPYLEAELLLAQLDEVSPETVERFLEKHAGTLNGNRVAARWLYRLARNGSWQAFLAAYRPDLGGNTLRCLHVRALHKAGRDKEALEQIAGLWLTPQSLPAQCDEALERWLERRKQPEKALWARAELAMEADNASLVRYLLGRVPVSDSVRELLYRPGLLPERAADIPVDAHHRNLAAFLLRRIAAVDYQQALTAWPALHERFGFSDEQQSAIREAIARPMIAANDPRALDWLQRSNADGSDQYLLEWQARLALREGDWREVAATIAQLSPGYARKPRWRYWLSRAEMALADTPPPAALERLNDLAGERHYYGFLAADLLRQPYRLNGHRQRYPELMTPMSRIPAVQRARELYALGELRWARLEWASALEGRDSRERIALAELAQQWGWDYQAIMTAIRADAWDDLDLRFPVAFAETFSDTAENEGIDLHWLYAIARHESAFHERAVSRVGAMGIMQMMPYTARRVAHRNGNAYNREHLFEARHSIPMGASYLNYLLEKFDGNRILATAAYNVGPGAVRRVLDRQQRELPFDIWVETLPYSETRDYVKGVMAFAVVYGRRLGEALPLVASTEQRIGPTVALALSEQETLSE